MASHVHNASGTWAVWLTVAVIVLAVAYGRGWVRLYRLTSNSLSACRALSFLAGLALAWVAVASPIGAGDERLLTFHMVQHLLLMTIAPPLILLGEPVMAFWHGGVAPFEPPVTTRPAPGPRVQRFLNVIAHPAACWLAATATLLAWHIPATFTLAMRSDTWHAIAQVSFFASGLLFWWPVITPWPSRPEPRWSTVLYLFLATLPCDILSAFLVFSDRVAYPAYLTASSPLQVLVDQQRAGALMWTVVTLVFLVAGAIISTQLLTCAGPRQRLAEVA